MLRPHPISTGTNTRFHNTTHFSERRARLVVVREKCHDLDGVGWLPPECLAKVVEDVATLFDPPAEVLPATSQDDAADGSWMIGAVDDSVFGQLAACPNIGERRDIAVEHTRASEDQKDRRREARSAEHKSELQSLMRRSYDGFY